MNSRYKTGLGLSGGGARAFAHIGLLKAFLEADIRPDVISGGSTGAVIACLYADGYQPEDILEIMKEVDMASIFDLQISRKALFTDYSYIKRLDKYIRAQDLESLKIPVFISAVDFIKGKLHFFSSGDIIPPLQAALSIPVLFQPVRIGNSYYCDGGALSNLPLEPLKGSCDKLIGSNVNPLRPVDSPGNAYNIAERTLTMVLFSNVLPNISACDLFIEPGELARYSLLDFGKADQIFRIGYEEGKRKIGQWLKEHGDR